MMQFQSIACPHCSKNSLFDINIHTHRLLEIHATRKSLDQLKPREFQRYNVCGHCHNTYYLTLIRIPRNQRDVAKA